MYDFHGISCEGAFIDSVAPLLSNLIEHKREDDYYVTGYLKNIKATVKREKLYLKGSLCKWFLGDNLQTLRRGDTERAIENLSDKIHVSVTNGKVTRIDFADNFLMNYPPEIYFPFLGDCRYYQREPTKNSLYYKSGNRTLIFYDKIKELNKNNVPIDLSFRNDNILRYEMRLLSRISNLFNRSALTVFNTYEESFYTEIINRWYEEFKAIKKLQKMKPANELQLTPQDFENYLLIKGIEATGGLDAVNSQIEEWKQQGIFKLNEHPSRAKKLIAQKYNSKILMVKSELINELEGKITQTMKYMR